MITLRPVVQDDLALISEWPAYPPDFHEVDYALRAHGWLAEYRQKLGTRCYVAQESGEPIGFSILSKTATDEAEFRVALRVDKIGHGYGKTVMTGTLAKGFTEMRLSKIHLFVPKRNLRALRVCRGIGFIETGECAREIHGMPVSVIAMTLEKYSWMKSV